MNNKGKSIILGMPFGTASNRLRKIVLFSILKRHQENECYRCGGAIETSTELSLEHKTAWRTPEQFWDIDNIAFSHLACNIPQNPSNGNVAKTVCPKGHSYVSAKYPSGEKRVCRICSAERLRKRRATESWQSGNALVR